MNIEDIKIGETYNIQVKVEKTIPEFNSVIFTINGGDNVYTFDIQDRTLKELLSPLPTPPKYDPTRLFKKGDIVKPCYVNERWCSHVWANRSNIHYEVAKDEDSLTSHMYLKTPNSPHTFLVHAAFFELVTPAEEVEPYSVKETMSHDGWQIVRDGLPLAIYDSQRHPSAKAAAEEERDRLNAEYYRKEQK